MSVSNNIIVAPVSFADVNQILGTSHTDLATLCKDTNIKMWARRKPVSYAKIGVMTNADFVSVHCGLSHTTNPLVDSNGRPRSDTWTYTKPSGGANSPYRLSDFDGYYPQAPRPLDIIFPDGDITISSSTSGNKIGFAITFEQGISGWRSDGTCLFMRDIFFNSSELNMYPTLALLHYTSSSAGVMYAVSADNKLSTYVASATDSSHLANQPVVNILLDLDDFKSKVASTYLAANTKWQCIVFLASSQLTGTIRSKYDTISNVVSSLGTTEMMELEGVTGADGDGYQNGFDRKTKKIVVVSWIDTITQLKLTTTLTRSGSTTTYNITSAVVEITRTSGQSAITFNVGFNAICVGGAMSTGGAYDNFTGVSFDTISLAANETTKSKTYSSSNFTGHSFVFNSLSAGNVSRAILNATIKNSGAEKSIATDIDCSAGSSSYTVHNP